MKLDFYESGVQRFDATGYDQIQILNQLEPGHSVLERSGTGK